MTLIIFCASCTLFTDEQLSALQAETAGKHAACIRDHVDTARVMIHEVTLTII